MLGRTLGEGRKAGEKVGRKDGRDHQDALRDDGRRSLIEPDVVQRTYGADGNVCQVGKQRYEEGAYHQDETQLDDGGTQRERLLHAHAFQRISLPRHLVTVEQPVNKIARNDGKHHAALFQKIIAGNARQQAKDGAAYGSPGQRDDTARALQNGHFAVHIDVKEHANAQKRERQGISTVAKRNVAERQGQQHTQPHTNQARKLKELAEHAENARRLVSVGSAPRTRHFAYAALHDAARSHVVDGEQHRLENGVEPHPDARQNDGNQLGPQNGRQHLHHLSAPENQVRL